MKFYIKQKVFSFKDKFNVFDAAGEVIYTAEGEIFSLGKKLHIRDINGEEIIFIRQKLASFLPKYEISVGNGEFFEVKKNFTLLRHEYSVPEYGITVKGDFFAHDYKVFQNGKEIAQMTKAWASWGDSYSIEIFDDEYALVALSIILVIDCCMESANNGN